MRILRVVMLGLFLFSITLIPNMNTIKTEAQVYDANLRTESRNVCKILLNSLDHNGNIDSYDKKYIQSYIDKYSQDITFNNKITDKYKMIIEVKGSINEYDMYIQDLSNNIQNSIHKIMCKQDCDAILNDKITSKPL